MLCSKSMRGKHLRNNDAVDQAIVYFACNRKIIVRYVTIRFENTVAYDKFQSYRKLNRNM